MLQPRETKLEAPVERGYLRFEHYGYTPRTKKWHVRNKLSGDILCDVEFYGAWMSYILAFSNIGPDEKVRMSTGCRKEIDAFIEEKMAEWRRIEEMGTEQCPECGGFMQVGRKEAYARDGDKTMIIYLVVKHCPRCQHTESEDYKKKVKSMGLKPY